MVTKRVIPSLMLLVLAGCKPDLEGRPSLVDSPRVIAIRSTPAEVKEEADVTYDSLVAAPVDDNTTPAFDWALCLARKPLATPGPIAESCLVPSGAELSDMGQSLSASGKIPKDACELFGPKAPTPNPGEPAVRPVDPDTTGGYYQPVRLLSQYGSGDSQYDVGVTRLMCGIAAGVTQAQLATFTRDYRANQNPSVQQVSFARPSGDQTVIDTSASDLPTASHDERLSFTVTWPTCPLTAACGDGICSAGEDLNSCPSDCQNPQGCQGSEAYLSYDTGTQSLTNRRESIRISWYATDGSFEHDRTGRTENEADQPNSSNTWTAPAHAAQVRFWLVIRDDRRGVNWATFDLTVVN